MKNVVCVLFMLFSFVSCVTTQDASNSNEQEFQKSMNSWVGSTKHNLLLSWGSPKSVSSDGNGGEILTFEELKRAFFNNYGYLTVVHRYMFYVDSRNIIYNWRYDRQGRQGQ